MKTPKLNNKQAALLLAAKACAFDYIKTIPEQENTTTTRVHDFMAGYFKAMKDCGYDVTDEKTLDGIMVVGDV